MCRQPCRESGRAPQLPIITRRCLPRVSLVSQGICQDGKFWTEYLTLLASGWQVAQGTACECKRSGGSCQWQVPCAAHQRPSDLFCSFLPCFFSRLSVWQHQMFSADFLVVHMKRCCAKMRNSIVQAFFGACIILALRMSTNLQEDHTRTRTNNGKESVRTDLLSMVF